MFDYISVREVARPNIGSIFCCFRCMHVLCIMSRMFVILSTWRAFLLALALVHVYGMPVPAKWPRFIKCETRFDNRGCGLPAVVISPRSELHHIGWLIRMSHPINVCDVLTKCRVELLAEVCALIPNPCVSGKRMGQVIGRGRTYSLKPRHAFGLNCRAVLCAYE